MPAPMICKKSTRTVRLIAKTAGGVITMAITEGKTCDRYVCTPVPNDFGKGYRVEKIGHDQDAYDVLVADGVGYDSCECLGYLRYGRCRHVSAIRKLILEGKI